MFRTCNNTKTLVQYILTRQFPTTTSRNKKHYLRINNFVQLAYQFAHDLSGFKTIEIVLILTTEVFFHKHHIHRENVSFVRDKNFLYSCLLPRAKYYIPDKI